MQKKSGAGDGDSFTGSVVGVYTIKLLDFFGGVHTIKQLEIIERYHDAKTPIVIPINDLGRASRLGSRSSLTASFGKLLESSREVYFGPNNEDMGFESRNVLRIQKRHFPVSRV